MRGINAIRGVAFLSCFTVIGVAQSDPTHPTVVPLPTDTSGAFRILSYNVAGLPQLISRHAPERNVPQIAERLDSYDIALVQEDFAYHEQLDRTIAQPHRSQPHRPWAGISDGLNRWSRFPFEGFVREAWRDCSGLFSAAWDCWASKGFSFARHLLAEGVSVDVYNLHMDAGGGSGDLRSRRSQVAQLIDAVKRWSSGRAVIIAGDTNLRPGDSSVVQSLLDAVQLQDACEVLRCGQPFLIDRVFFRSSPEVQLQPARYSNEEGLFDDAQGRPLSDHLPVAVDFEWFKIAAAVASL